MNEIDRLQKLAGIPVINEVNDGEPGVDYKSDTGEGEVKKVAVGHVDNERGMIGKEPFEYKNKMIVGYADDPYRNFGVKGDNAFIVDSLLAKPGPSWNDFV